MAVLSVVSVILSSSSAVRPTATPATLLTLIVGALLTVEQIGSRMFRALSVESPGGLEIPMVVAVVQGVGPLIVALLGSILVCAVHVIQPHRRGSIK